MLFKANANYSIPTNQETLRKIVGDEILNLAYDLINKVNEVYYLDLYSESFMTPFSLHLKNLILRVKSETYTKNPMTQTIKASYPTVYDIAIYMSIELMQRYKIQIIEDEVAFLALHIGAEIENRKINEYKIKCVLYCPEYMHIIDRLYNQLLIDFGNQIDIIKTVTSKRDLPDESYDLLFSTIKTEHRVARDTLIISPFAYQIDKTKIYMTLEQIQKNNKNYILKKYFNNYFRSELFIANPKLESKDSLIHLLCNKMLEAEYVQSDFEEKVLIRENAASTAFENVAIPHSVEMDAFQTSIAVAISKEGINWNEHKVHIVLLIAINKTDKKIFHELYEAIIQLFCEKEVIESIKFCHSFQDFKDFVYNKIAALQ